MVVPGLSYYVINSKLATYLDFGSDFEIKFFENIWKQLKR